MSVRQFNRLVVTVQAQGRNLDEMLQDANKNADIADDGWVLYDLTSERVSTYNRPRMFYGEFKATYIRKEEA